MARALELGTAREQNVRAKLPRRGAGTCATGLRAGAVLAEGLVSAGESPAPYPPHLPSRRAPRCAPDWLNKQREGAAMGRGFPGRESRAAEASGLGELREGGARGRLPSAPGPL